MRSKTVSKTVNIVCLKLNVNSPLLSVHRCSGNNFADSFVCTQSQSGMIHMYAPPLTLLIEDTLLIVDTWMIVDTLLIVDIWNFGSNLYHSWDTGFCYSSLYFLSLKNLPS